MDNPHAAIAFRDAQLPLLWDEVDVPILRINIFGCFEMLYGGEVRADPSVCTRRLKTLIGILALNHGRELHCDYLADSFWPNSPAQKQRNCFYNLWYKLMRYCVPDGMDRQHYFIRQQHSCRLIDDYVSTDVEEVERACAALKSPALDPKTAVEAYRELQRAYRGDLLPGENLNGIVLRARDEWRSRVVDSLYAAAQRMRAQGEASTALWLVEAATRVDSVREDLVRLRMRLLIDLGRPSAALRVYDDMRVSLIREMGTGPSAQSSQLLREAVETIPFDSVTPVHPQSRRRGRAIAHRQSITVRKPTPQLQASKAGTNG